MFLSLLLYDVNKEQREKISRENERRTVIMKKMISLILVLALALCMVPVFAEEEAAEEETSELALMTYAEYAEAEIDAPVYVETYVQATQSWWEDTKSPFMPRAKTARISSITWPALRKTLRSWCPAPRLP